MSQTYLLQNLPTNITNGYREHSEISSLFDNLKLSGGGIEAQEGGLPSIFKTKEQKERARQEKARREEEARQEKERREEEARQEEAIRAKQKENKPVNENILAVFHTVARSNTPFLCSNFGVTILTIFLDIVIKY